MSRAQRDLSDWDEPRPVEAEIERLATLPDLKYEEIRKAESKRLDMRQAVLDKAVSDARKSREKTSLELPTPDIWDTPVGDEIGQVLIDVINRHLVLPKHTDIAMALWVLHAHAFDTADVSPNLAITSPEKQCGKSTVLDVLQRLVPRPLPTSNATPAVIFRAIDQYRPTLLIDEADTFLHGHEELRGILNSSHCRSTANVIRTVGDDYEPRLFSTWTPVAIAKIGKLPDTLADRSIPIEMRRKLQDEAVERLRRDRVGHLEATARKAARWAEDHGDQLTAIDPDLPENLSDRAQDNWRHMVAIADLIGLGDEARTAALALNGSAGDGDPSIRVQLLNDINTLFAERGVDRVSSDDICVHLASLEDRPWAEWRRGNPISKQQLARKLKPFGVAPGTVRIGDRTVKGYRVEQFEEVFARYLPQ